MPVGEDEGGCLNEPMAVLHLLEEEGHGVTA